MVFLIGLFLPLRYYTIDGFCTVFSARFRRSLGSGKFHNYSVLIETFCFYFVIIPLTCWVPMCNNKGWTCVSKYKYFKTKSMCSFWNRGTLMLYRKNNSRQFFCQNYRYKKYAKMIKHSKFPWSRTSPQTYSITAKAGHKIKHLTLQITI